MSDRDLLLEIGTEEIPARFLPPAIRQVEESSRKLLTDQRITFGKIQAYATPCRLILHIETVAALAETHVIEKSGPPLESAYDASGRPTQALAGFLKSAGASEKDVVEIQKKDRKFVGVRLTEKGRPTAGILKESLPVLLTSLHFPKNMRWRTNDPTVFARPVRNLLCLLHGKPLKIAAFGLTAGDRTTGNKFFHPSPFRVTSSAAYFLEMKKRMVVVSGADRRDKILKDAARIAKLRRLSPELADDLVNEVVYLTEFPTVLLGDFNPEFLKIPDIVLKSAMSHHQRYFPVTGRTKGIPRSPGMDGSGLTDAKGCLAPHFLVVRNGPADSKRLVAKGNGRVLAARFSDAKYFFETDRKKNLADRIDGLKGVVYLQGLGTLHDRAARVRSLLVQLAPRLGVDIDLARFADVAFLCKADLLTEVVREFPELQGLMGQIYASLEGQPREIADAIAEHYQPKGAQDPVPASTLGALLALADKFELLLGAFSIGIRPSASADPYGLRRAAIGIARILLARAWHLPVRKFAEEASSAFSNSEAVRKAVPEAMDFFRARLEAQLKESHPAEFVAACLNVSDDPCEVAGKVAAFSKVSAEGKEKWVTLLRTAKRAYNIVKAEKNLPALNPALFQQDEERALHRAILDWRAHVQSIPDRKYTERLRSILQMAEPLHRFFEKVFVMVEDAAVRQTRLALIKTISDAFRSYAEFDRIAVGD